MNTPSIDEYQVTFKKHNQKNGRHFITVFVIFKGITFNVGRYSRSLSGWPYFLQTKTDPHHFTCDTEVLTTIVRQCITSHMKARVNSAGYEVTSVEDIPITL